MYGIGEVRNCHDGGRGGSGGLLKMTMMRAGFVLCAYR